MLYVCFLCALFLVCFLGKHNFRTHFLRLRHHGLEHHWHLATSMKLPHGEVAGMTGDHQKILVPWLHGGQGLCKDGGLAGGLM